MRKKWNKDVLEACTQTLLAYKRLIANPPKEKKGWTNYGYSCRICRALDDNCSRCPINFCVDCSSISASQTMDGFATATGLVDALEKKRSKAIIKAAKARYLWLRKRLRQSGIEIDRKFCCTNRA